MDRSLQDLAGDKDRITGKMEDKLISERVMKKKRKRKRKKDKITGKMYTTISGTITQ
jgi:hypothetical protein